MRVIVPSTLTLTASTADGSTYAEWSAATSYVVGDRVKVTSTVPHREYEASQASTNKPPADNPEYWIDLGVTNPYKLIDDKTSTRTVQLEGFSATVEAPGRATHLAIFGATLCESVRIQQTVDSVELLDVTYPMRAFSEASSWSEYFFSPTEYRDSLVAELPGWYSDSEVTVTFSGSAGVTVGIGHLVIGGFTRLGKTVFPVTASLIDYSVRETDEFGDTILTERAYARRLEGQSLIEPSSLRDGIHRVMASRRAAGSVWDANDDGTDVDAWRLFGFCREYDITDEDATVLTFELYGLT